MFKVKTYSVRDSDPRGFLSYDDGNGGTSDLFAGPDDVKRRVPKLLRDASATWQVRMVRADQPDTDLMIGFRAGPGGTGNKWTWRDA